MGPGGTAFINVYMLSPELVESETIIFQRSSIFSGKKSMNTLKFYSKTLSDIANNTIEELILQLLSEETCTLLLTFSKSIVRGFVYNHLLAKV